MQTTKKIVLTGGPCAGKTTAISTLTDYFQSQGWKCVTVNEAATDLIMNGFSPTTMPAYDFQRMTIDYQKHREDLLQAVAEKSGADKILMICDRGICDNFAYCDEETKQRLVQEEGGIDNLFKRYDAVLHLTTAAYGAETAYTKANNAARRESPTEARIADTKTFLCWSEHPHLFNIDNHGNFEDKLQAVVTCVADVIGEAKPYKHHGKKYLVQMPDFDAIKPIVTAKQHITQGFDWQDGIEQRWRDTETQFGHTYTYTEKESVSALFKDSPSTRITSERAINKREFDDAMDSVGEEYRLEKDRYILRADGVFATLDVYPADPAHAIVEISADDAGKSDRFLLSHFDVIADVTRDDDLEDASLARRLSRGRGNLEIISQNPRHFFEDHEIYRHLIKMPDAQDLAMVPQNFVQHITQNYIDTTGIKIYDSRLVELYVRKIEAANQEPTYTLTARLADDICGCGYFGYFKVERPISQDAYENYLQSLDPTCPGTIEKTQYTLPLKGDDHDLELDVYKGSDTYAILKAFSSKRRPAIPDYFEVIDYLVWDSQFSDEELAKMLPVPNFDAMVDSAQTTSINDHDLKPIDIHITDDEDTLDTEKYSM